MIRSPFSWLAASACCAGLPLVGLLLPDAALARGGSFSPPAGQLPATAPGGTEGLAGPRNVEEAVRGGHGYRKVHRNPYRAGAMPGYRPVRGQRPSR